MSPDPASVRPAPPLCVDLDGTLVHTDTLWESLIALLARSPLRLFTLIGPLVRGKAAFKHALAERTIPDVERLPYNERLVEYLRAQKAEGRRLILATAANQRIADAVAAHLGMFDDVVASDAGRNLRGAHKAAALKDRLGDSFVYAGNDAADHAVWQHAEAAIPVSAPKTVVRRINVPIEREFARPTARIRSLIAAMRVHQWVKNLLVYLPIVTSGAMHDVTAISAATAAFVALSLAASAQYVLNDLLDVESDRAHRTKRRRPFASGDLALPAGFVMAAGLLAASTAIGLAAGGSLVYWITTYFAASAAYSLRLKTLPLVDVFVLASLYTLRVVIGGAVTGYFASVWLLTFSGFFFLSLAFAKRYIEISRTTGPKASNLVRRGYEPGDEMPVMIMGIASAFAAALVLSLYVETGIASTIYSQPRVLWLMVPLALFWQARIWLSAWRGNVDDDPVRFAMRDAVLWGVVGCAALVYAAARWV